MEAFFKVLKTFTTVRHHFDNRIRVFCHKLWMYYNEDSAGKRHKVLLESERTAQLEKKIFHVDVDSDVYREAITGYKKFLFVELKKI